MCILLETAFKFGKLYIVQFVFALHYPGSLIERIVVITKSAEEQRCWMKTLETQCEKYRRTSHAPAAVTPSPIVKQAPVTQIPPPPKVNPNSLC